MERLGVTNGASRFVGGGLKSVASQSAVDPFFRVVHAILTRRKGLRSMDNNFPIGVDRETESGRERREETASVFRFRQFRVNCCHVNPVARVICTPTDSDKGLFARYPSPLPVHNFINSVFNYRRGRWLSHRVAERRRRRGRDVVGQRKIGSPHKAGQGAVRR